MGAVVLCVRRGGAIGGRALKQALLYLWLIGGVFYAVSTWLFVDAVYFSGRRESPASSSSTARSLRLWSSRQAAATSDVRQNLGVETLFSPACL
jgi:hypothetical protein